MDGTTFVSGNVVSTNPGTAWHIKGAGDFDGDGKADILWQKNDGETAIWFINGTSYMSGGTACPFNPGTSWIAMGAGDFNGDGKADILWQNTDDTPCVWLMNGLSLVSGGTLTNNGSSWHVIAMST